MKTTLKINIKFDSEQPSLRLDKYIQDYLQKNTEDYKSITRSFVNNLIDNGAIRVNDKLTKSSYVVKNKDQIEIFFPETKSTELKPTNIPLDIVYEDKDLIVINKPSGLVIHPAAGHEDDTLVNALLFHTNDLSMKNEMRPGIVHRIDKETSGLLVVAKNDQAHENLSAQFKNKTTHRIYYALVQGKFLKPSGSIKSYLARHPTDRKRYASVRENNKIITQFKEHFENGKWAVTHYKVMKTKGDYTLVRLQLETGRTHQIRVHLSENGHPLLGDVTYGFSKLKNQQLELKRFFLHAAELGFIHPTTQEEMKFSVDWPKEDLEFLKKMGFESV